MTIITSDRSTPAAMPMALFRNIGNRFRRPDTLDESPYDSPSTGGEMHGHTAMSSMKMAFQNAHLPTNATAGATLQQQFETDETPDLYYEDRTLGVSIHTLEQVRGALRQLTTSANDHSRMLQSSSVSQRSLGDSLQSVLNTGDNVNGVRFEDKEEEDEQVKENAMNEENKPHGQGQQNNSNNNNNNNEHFSHFLSKGAIEVQQSLGSGMIHLSQVSSKLSLAISKPINDLMTSFEDRYSRKIVPLRKRYVDQKGQYLKYMKAADMAETDERRSYYEALADAAKPVWNRTSTELRTEADVMTELTAKNIAQWSRTIALQHERAFAISSANMADAFTRAKELGNLNK